jgi:hypothetical protein
VLPLAIFADIPSESRRPGITNIIAALNQRDRMIDITIRNIPKSLLKKVATTKKPFLALTRLDLESLDDNVLVLPDSFLGGSAPRLQVLYLSGIPFQGLPKLLLTTSDLAYLSLLNIPESGYISPEAMVTGLSALTRLKHIELGFRSPRPRADRPRHRLPAHARVVLPALTMLWFQGTSEYFEDIVSRIEAPRLDHIPITFFNQLIFDTPQLCHFISRTQILKTPNRVKISFSTSSASVSFFQPDGTPYDHVLQLMISCRAQDWQLSSLSQLCTSSFPLSATLERLEIDDKEQDWLEVVEQIDWEESVEHIQWLELLHPFVSVKDLIVSEKLVQVVSPALQQLVGEQVAEVLPALQNIFLEGRRPSNPVQEAVFKFIVARRVSGHPVTVYHQDKPGKEYVRWEVVD